MNENSRDLVLGPNEYAYVRDDTKGKVSAYIGPNKTSLAGTDRPVIYDHNSGRFTPCTPEQSIQTFLKAGTGFYVELVNPSNDGKQPEPGGIRETIDLQYGKKVNIPGPFFAPLWPGQYARVLTGHNLRTNQYLVCRVYDADEAKKNWDNAIVKRQSQLPDGMDLPKKAKSIFDQPFDLATGQLFIVKGTDIAFFIPPTGVEVLPEQDNFYVRNAVTLEQLNYCILLNESGEKRYVRGPAVVFPEPTEQFLVRKNENGNESRKFRAFELNEITGIYIKVISPYEEDGKQYKEGDELFITGVDEMIYFPRPEHSIIKYGEHELHYAVAIPSGEARYVLDRLSGEITTVKGPQMLLLDPRKKVFVRRILDDKTVELWFPQSIGAKQYNAQLSEASLDIGYVEDSHYASAAYRNNSLDSVLGTSNSNLRPKPKGDRAIKSTFGDSITRSDKFTKPRMLQLDSKYEGAIRIDVWTGYAVKVVDGTGKSRVVIGPAVIHLNYDEKLEKFSLSTGTPKSAAHTIDDVYLRVLNNTISDEVLVETKDMVQINLRVSYKVDFTGENPSKWFDVENYVQYLVDNCRSILRNRAKQMLVQEFHENYINVIRDAILGASKETGKRGRLFEENGMLIKDVEVLFKTIKDPEVSSMLLNAQRSVSKVAVDLVIKEQQFNLKRAEDELQRKLAELELTNSLAALEREREKLEAERELMCEKHAFELEKKGQERLRKEAEMDLQHIIAMKVVETKAEVDEFTAAKEKERQVLLDEISKASLSRKKGVEEWEMNKKDAELRAEIDKIKAVAEAEVAKSSSIQPGLIEALNGVAKAGVLENVVEHLAPLAIVEGKSVGNVVTELFRGTGFEETIAKLAGASVLTK